MASGAHHVTTLPASLKTLKFTGFLFTELDMDLKGLKKLETLEIASLSFTGKILNFPSSLRRLDLGAGFTNQEEELDLSHLKNLEYIRLNRNAFEDANVVVKMPDHKFKEVNI